MRESCRSSGGQAAISFVLLIGSIVVFVGVTLGFLNTSFISSSLGFGAAQRALATATAGANDGFLRLVRNKDFSDTDGYSVPLSGNSATVVVTQDTPSSGLVTIVSRATVLFHTRKVQVVASVDASAGNVRLVSWQEVQ